MCIHEHIDIHMGGEREREKERGVYVTRLEELLSGHLLRKVGTTFPHLIQRECFLPPGATPFCWVLNEW